MVVECIALLLPVAAFSGWWAGKNSAPSKNKKSFLFKFQQDYFTGLNYLLNEQRDKAVDVFIKLIEVDSETVETHLALGSLFRRKGEVDRAIRVHQNIIARPHLDKRLRVQALYELAQDYLSAGVLDRAERLFLELFEMGEEKKQSLECLLDIYQKEKDWKQAIETAEKLQKYSKYPMNTVIAQYYCELSEKTILDGFPHKAAYYLQQAQLIDSTCARASLIQGKLAMASKHYEEAIQIFKRVKDQDADFLSETVESLIQCYLSIGGIQELVDYFEECLEIHPRISLVIALAHYRKQHQSKQVAIEYIIQQMTRVPSLQGLSYLVDLYCLDAKLELKETLNHLRVLMQRLWQDQSLYRCHHCGFSGKRLYWLCPSCHEWTVMKPVEALEYQMLSMPRKKESLIA